jgi:hypothetical protein
LLFEKISQVAVSSVIQATLKLAPTIPVDFLVKVLATMIVPSPLNFSPLLSCMLEATTH